MGNTYWGDYALEESVTDGRESCFCIGGESARRRFCRALPPFWRESTHRLQVVATLSGAGLSRFGRAFAPAPCLSAPVRAGMDPAGDRVAFGASQLGAEEVADQAPGPLWPGVRARGEHVGSSPQGGRLGAVPATVPGQAAQTAHVIDGG